MSKTKGGRHSPIVFRVEKYAYQPRYFVKQPDGLSLRQPTKRKALAELRVFLKRIEAGEWRIAP